MQSSTNGIKPLSVSFRAIGLSFEFGLRAIDSPFEFELSRRRLHIF